jgi:hypothetical protein
VITKLLGTFRECFSTKFFTHSISAVNGYLIVIVEVEERERERERKEGFKLMKKE